MQYCREYDSKIREINRYVYTIKFENGKALFYNEDVKK